MVTEVTVRIIITEPVVYVQGYLCVHVFACIHSACTHNLHELLGAMLLAMILVVKQAFGVKISVCYSK